MHAIQTIDFSSRYQVYYIDDYPKTESKKHRGAEQFVFHPPVRQGAKSAGAGDQRLLLVLVVARERNVVAVVAIELVLHELQDAPGALRAERDE